MNAVNFVSQEQRCVAFSTSGQKGFNMSTCMVNLRKSIRVNIDYLPDGIVRVKVNNGEIIPPLPLYARYLAALHSFKRIPNCENRAQR